MGFELLRRAFGMPPDVVAREVDRRVRRRVRDWRSHWRARTRPTYWVDDPPREAPRRLVATLDPGRLASYADIVFERAERAMAHEFDLLGSGWTRVERADPVAVNSSNRDESRRIAALLPRGYRCIDWHLDFKSGYRWPGDVVAARIAIAPGDGVDVKVPWELARMQHLPALAWAYGLASDADGHRAPRPAVAYRDELRAQIIDFVAQNPPGFGVNYACTMDVALRMSGWLVAFDLVRALEGQWDAPFVALLVRALREHARFVVEHLEWSEIARGNHYLANVAGLLVVAAGIPSEPEHDRWLRFAAREWMVEVQRQFHPDGSGFEASSGYHRLSGDMVVWPAAVLQAVTVERRNALTSDDWPALRRGVPSPVLKARETAGGVTLLGEEVLGRIREMGRFAEALLDGQGRVLQIGDNDDGRFLKIFPAWTGSPGTGGEDPADHRHLPASCGVFWGDEPSHPEAMLLRSILGAPLAGGRPAVSEGLESFSGMGLDIYRLGPAKVVLRCGEVGQGGNGGHAHCDQLSLDLMFDGRWLLLDPGTGVYTPDPDLANRLRSVRAHNTLALEGAEQGRWRPGRRGLFQMTDLARAEVVERTLERWVGRHHAWGAPHERTVDLGPDGLVVTDHCAAPGVKTVRMHVHPCAEVELRDRSVNLHSGRARLRISFDSGQISVGRAPYSPAYGKVGSCTVVCARLDGDWLRCRIEWQS